MLWMWIKALHLIAVVCWFAMLFYLPRLFVYHAMTDNKDVSEQFKIMERRLYKGIGIPSMIATLVFGGWLIHFNWAALSVSAWFWIKMALVILLIAYHHICGSYVKKFAQDSVKTSHIFFRWFNEFPTIILIAVIIMAVTKQPF